MSVRPKILAWKIYEFDPGTEVAETPFGNYEIRILGEEDFEIRFRLSASYKQIPSTYCSTLEEAKKAAQRDFSDKVWKCMEIELRAFTGYTNAGFGERS